MGQAAEDERPSFMTASPKIAFFLPSLGGGGAEMHALRVANADVWGSTPPEFVLARRGGRFEGKVATGRLVHPLLPGWVRSSALSMMLSVLPLRAWMRAHRPDVVVSFLNHTSVVLHRASLGLSHRPRILVGLQNNFSVEQKEWRGLFGDWFKKAVLASHRTADGLVALSWGVANDYVRMFPGARAPRVIYNAGYDDALLLDVNQPMPRAALPSPGVFRIVACGRLTEQKDYPLLLQAFQRVSQTHRVELVILGEGHLRAKLEQMILALGLENRVSLVGFQSSPGVFVARAHLFVLSSAWEGFGNVLVEAMAVGTPVVAMDCPFGPAEIIQDGLNGRLVSERTPHALAQAICEALDDEPQRKRWSQAGRARAAEFHPRKVAEAYRDWMGEVILRRSPSGGIPE